MVGGFLDEVNSGGDVSPAKLMLFSEWIRLFTLSFASMLCTRMFLTIRGWETRGLANVAEEGDRVHLAVPIVVVDKLEVLISIAFQHALDVLLDFLCVVEHILGTQNIALLRFETGITDKRSGSTHLR